MGVTGVNPYGCRRIRPTSYAGARGAPAMRMPDAPRAAGHLPVAQEEADARYWQDVVRFRWLVTAAYLALTATGVLPYREPWFWLAAGVLVASTIAYTIYRRRTHAYTLYQDISTYVDVLTITLVLISIGTIDHPVWVSYALVIPAVANFKGHRYNLMFVGVVLLSYASAYAASQALGGQRGYGREAIVTGVLMLLIAVNSTVISANNRRLRDVIRRQAVTDPLTGLANRRLLFERLDHWPPSERALAVMMIDLDDFKMLNESLGHITADRILTSAGALLREMGGDSAFAARFGGDEFALLVEVNDRATAQALAERIIEQGRERIGIGMTAGIALCPDDAATPERALHLADGNLRAAKAAGKERVVLRPAA